MFRNSRRKIAGLLGSTIKETSCNRSSGNAAKASGKVRTGRKLRAEQLEARNLFAGLSFESVITTEKLSSGRSYGYAVAADAVGNTYTGGFFTGIADFDRNAAHPGNQDILTARGAGDAFLAKYGPSGEFLWARRMGGESTVSSEDRVQSISVANSGEVFLIGKFAATADFGSNLLTSAGLTDSFIAKVDQNGNFLWANSWGAEGHDEPRELVVDQMGNATVRASSSTVTLPRQDFTSIRQFDPSGTSSWISEQPSGLNFNKLVNDASGDLYVTGRFSGTADLDPGPGESMVTGLATEKNTFVSKLSSSGALQWTTHFVADISVNSASSIGLSSVVVSNDGTIAVLGSYSGDVRIGAMDSTFSLPSTQTSRRFFTTLDPSTGARNAVKVYEGQFDSLVTMIATKDGYAVTGNTPRDAVFSPVPGISLASKGGDDIFIMTLDSTGDISWAGTVGGEGVIDAPVMTSSDGNGGLLIAGFSSSTLFDFDPHVSNSYYVSSPSSFFLKLKPTPGTKFYVVDDASANRTFEYAADSSAVESYSLNSANSAPRGSASTVAGDKVWVVDANKKIYVYNNDGVLLGSWTAGSVASNATIEGITTNGTDVWLVDARQDRVYRYANAASRLSGSQNAASSFALNSGNTNPKDLVTDGASIWVVNDSTTDKIFKYTMTGALVGSWTIDSANKAPTGLTIDPSGASQSIWIVDNGTDRVYEYTNSRSRNSGSQPASISFALAAGNTNPQGIADPPAAAPAVMVVDTLMLDTSNGTEMTADEYDLNVLMQEHSIPAVSVDSRDSTLAQRTDLTRDAIGNGIVRDTGAVDSKTYSVPFLSSGSASSSVSLAAVDAAFASPDALFEHDQHESLGSFGKPSVKGRRLR